MKLLVATELTQGHRPNDFNYAKKNELLVFAPTCSEKNPDSICACKRTMLGVFSRRATTTFLVKDINLTEDMLFDIMTTYHKEFQICSEDQISAMAANDVKLLMETGDMFPVGSVVERRGEYLSIRQ